MDIKNWFRKLFSSKITAIALIAAVILGGFFVYNAFASSGVNLTTATGGSAVSIDTTSNGACSGVPCGQYTTLTGPKIEETAVGQIKPGTYTLNLPIGWEFDTAVNVLVGTTGGATGFSVSSTAVFPTATTLSFTVNTASTSAVDGVNLNGIKIRPTGTAAPTSGNIVMTFTPSASIEGIDGTTNLGTLNTVSGTATKINVETASNSPTPVKLGSIGLNAGSGTQTVYSIRRDQFNNFVDNFSATWTLVSKFGGVVDGDLTPGSGLNATFAAHNVGTAIIHANGGGFDSDDSNLVTVHPVAPGTPAFNPILSHPGYVNASEELAGFTIRVTGLGGAIAGDTVELLLDGASFSTPKIVTLAGGETFVNFSITHLDLGADGSKSLTAKVATAIPAETQTSGALTFTLDTSAPTVNITAPLAGTLVNANPKVTFTDSELTSAECSVNGGGTWTACVSGSTSLGGISGFGALAQGAFTLSLRDTDLAGNPGTDTEIGIIKDTIVPTATAAITPSAGYAKVGDTISVTITAGGAQADLVLGGACTVNGKNVSGSFVNAGLGIYNLTYTVAEGDTDRASGALPISCVLEEPALNSVTVSSFDSNTLIVDANTPAAPVISSIAGDNMINNAEKTTIHIVGTAEPGTTVNVSLNDESVGPTTVLGSGVTGVGGGYDVTIDGHTLIEGTAHATARATDAAGNVSGPATRTALKDTIAPATPVITQIGAVGNYINIENVSAVHVIGTAEAGSTVSVALTSVASVANGGTATGGSYDIMLNCTGLTDGTVTPSVTATDAAGNMSLAATLPTATKDTVSPILPTAVGFTTVGGTVNPGFVNTTNTNFTGNATVIAGDATGGYAELLIDGSPLSTPVRDTTILIGDTAVNFNAGLTLNSQVQTQIASGSHVFTVKLCDAANNCVISASNASATADYVVPTFSSIVFGTDAWVNAAEAISGVNLVISTTDLENGRVVSCTIEDVGAVHIVGPVTGPVGGNSATIGTGNLTSLDEGNITARCDVSDLAGNPAVQGTQSVKKDTIAPSGYTVSIDQAYVNLANQAAISFTFAGAEIGTTYNYSFSDGTNSVTGTGIITSATQNISSIDLSPLNNGSITLSVTLTDLALNVGLPATDTVLKDTIPPTVDAGLDQTRDALFVQTATATDGGSGINPASFAWTKVSGSGNITFGGPNALTTTIISDVTGRVHYVLQFTASDLAGNSASDTFSLYWTNNSLNAIAFSPANGATGVAIASGTATVTFDSAAKSIIESKIDIVKDSTGASVKDSVALTAGGTLQINYSGLEYGTTYRIVLGKDAVEDASGYMSNAATSSFVTVSAPLNPAPNLTGISATPTQYTATISFTSDQAGLAKVLYGGVTYGFATDYMTMTASSGNVISLFGLDCNTTYHFKIYAKNSDGVEGSTSDIGFSTTACPVGPSILSYNATPSQNSAVIVVVSNATPSGTAKVIYGKTSAYGFTTDYVTTSPSASISLDGLDCNTTYHYKIYVKDNAGLETGSTDHSFATTACPVGPNLAFVSSTPHQYDANIVFGSDQNGTAKIIYGTTSAYGFTTDYLPMVLGSGYNTFTIGGLNCATTYHYKVYGKNAAGQETSLSDRTLTTTACPATAPTVTITSPLGSTIVNGSIAITATNGTEYQIDGGAWISLATPWNTSLVSNGTHMVRAKGGTPTGYSDTIVVVVNNGNVPDFVWNAPTPGAILSNTATVNAVYMISNFDSGTVEYSINGAPWATAGDATQTIAVQVGTNTLQLKATKTVGGVTTTGYSTLNTFQVSEVADTAAPSFVAQVPANGTTGVSVNPAAIYVDFDEALNSTTISSTSVKLCLVSDATCASPVSISSPMLTEGGTRIQIGGPSITLNYNTAYWIQIDSTVTDLAGNPITAYGSTTTSAFTTQTEPTGELAIGTAVMIKSDGLADDSYTNGWEWKLRITLPSDENAIALKFADWTSGVNTLLAGGNMRYYSEQISSGAGSSGTPVAITAANTYPANVDVTSDADPTVPGIQTDIHIQVKIPATTVGGAYSSAFAVRSSVPVE